MDRRRSSQPATLALAAFAAFHVGCAARQSEVGMTASGHPIVQIQLPIANVYLVHTKQPFLVDAASEDDLPALEGALAERGLRPEDLRLAVITHAHADHVGMAKALQARGVPVWVGAGDVAQARRGHNDALKATSLTASMLDVVLPSTFPPVTPDRTIDGPVELSTYGVEGFVAPMPGHTPGSLVVVLDDDKAFVGDQMLGGILGGAMCSDEPGEHYFQADFDGNRANIRRLTNMGIQTFFLGHGGPVTLDAVRDEFGG